MVDPTQLHPSEVRTVGLVASHRAWRTEFARYVQDHITGLRVRVLRDPRAIDETIDVVVIDDSSTFLNRESLRQLREAGVQIIGIYDPNEHQGQGQAHLNRLGIADVASAELMASQLVQLIQEVTKDIDDDLETGLAATLAPSPAVSAMARVNGAELPTDRGTIITVGGPATLAAVEVAVGAGRRAGHRAGHHPPGRHRRDHPDRVGPARLPAGTHGARRHGARLLRRRRPQLGGHRAGPGGQRLRPDARAGRHRQPRRLVAARP